LNHPSSATSSCPVSLTTIFPFSVIFHVKLFTVLFTFKPFSLYCHPSSSTFF
jgi:hypothetical protein